MSNAKTTSLVALIHNESSMTSMEGGMNARESGPAPPMHESQRRASEPTNLETIPEEMEWISDRKAGAKWDADPYNWTRKYSNVFWYAHHEKCQYKTKCNRVNFEKKLYFFKKPTKKPKTKDTKTQKKISIKQKQI